MVVPCTVRYNVSSVIVTPFSSTLFLNRETQVKKNHLPTTLFSGGNCNNFRTASELLDLHLYYWILIGHTTSSIQNQA